MREFDVLEHVFKANSTLGDRVLIPPGDDMGMVRMNGSRLLAAVDQLVDGVHFKLGSTPIELIGRKAVTRSLSDIAAMAARPLGTLAAVVLPPDFGSQPAIDLFDAMRRTAVQFDSPLVGGDIAVHAGSSHPLTCSITVFAEPASTPPVLRSGARVGDRVYVTGRLGGSLQPDGLGHHLTFEPRIREALELAQTLGDHLHAMLDISDGLGRDASHIAIMSGVQIVLDASAIPCTPGCDWRRGLSDGEDYELCFTCSPDADVPSRILGVPVTAVGEVRPAPGISSGQSSVIVRDGSTLLNAQELGWQHRGAPGPAPAPGRQR